MSRTFWFTLCLAVLLDLCTGSHWSLFSGRTKRQACNINDEFRCTSGQCIDEFSICDGEKHCADGSDETVTLCANISCPKYTFQCKYGPCISLGMKCDGKVDCMDGSDEDILICGSGTTTTPRATTSQYVTPSVTTDGSINLSDGCNLPEPPDQGSYISPLCKDLDSPACQSVPGTPVAKYWLLRYKCRNGFEIFQDSQFAVCSDKKWTPFLPTCKKLCPKLESLSLRVTCIYQGSIVNCSQSMRPGTKAKSTCNKNYHRKYQPKNAEIECQEDGSWNEPLFSCTPACGKANEVLALISQPGLHVSPSEHGQYPWHVGIYRRYGNNEWMQYCSGTLISRHIVLTAAHCVYKEDTKSTINISDIKIGLGKYYRDWMKTEAGEEKRDVREIVLPSLYKGKVSSYAQDIALIDMTSSVTESSFIMPACVDWEVKFKLTPGMLGTLNVWVETETHMRSPVLFTAQLPIIDRAKCKSEASFQRYITPDKFCAEYKNGIGPENGSGGSGLTFVHEDGVHRVFGVLSTAVNDHHTYVTFTNVTDVEIFQWLNNEQSRLRMAH